MQLDRGLTQSFTFRFGFLQRTTRNDLMIEPVAGPASTGAMQLSSKGRSRYTEAQFLLVYDRVKRGLWNASYVFSRARGDLNTVERYFSETPPFVVRPNQYGPLPFEAKHRFLLYGQYDLFKRWEIRLTPLFEVRTGFPFSAVDDRLNFVGRRNEAGRFPLYMSLDLGVTKRVKVPFFKDKYVRAGFAVLNLTDHFNPRDVLTNITSPNYGKFYNSLGRSFKLKFDVGN